MSKQKCLLVTLLGAPNAGKSTLVNKLTGAKVSIVSNKVQTTRNIIKGINVKENTQLIYIDTPGVFQARHNLEKAIVQEALQQIQLADCLLFILDVKAYGNKNTSYALDLLKQENKKAILILNKVDIIAKPKLLTITHELHQTGLFSDIFMLSALDGHGVEDLEKHLINKAPVAPFLYPEDQISDLPMRFLASEITREKLFQALIKELPYNLSVETEDYKEDEESVTIHQVIYVMKEGQKKIIIGNKGEMIKEIGTKARIELANLLEKRVGLYLHVKVKEDWLDKPYMYAHMNLKFPG